MSIVNKKLAEYRALLLQNPYFINEKQYLTSLYRHPYFYNLEPHLLRFCKTAPINKGRFNYGVTPNYGITIVITVSHGKMEYIRFIVN